MAVTQISDVIIPEIFNQYTMEQSIYKSRFFRSNIIQPNASIIEFLNGGGRTFNVPFWQDTAGTSGDIPSESVNTTINNITSDKQIGVRLMREKAWGSNNMAGILAGSDPLQAIADRVTGYWAQAYDIVAIKILEGVVADNIANDSSDLVNETTAQFNDDGVIDAQGLLGENGTVGRSDLNNGDFVAIMVNPKVYSLMRKLDLIDFVPVSTQDRPLELYMNMQVIVDRNATENTTPDPDLYTSYIFKSGFIGFGESSARYLPTELDRDPKLGGGQDQLFTRRVFGLHPGGWAYQSPTIAGEFPTDAELSANTAWSRVNQKENSGFVAYTHTL